MAFDDHKVASFWARKSFSYMVSTLVRHMSDLSCFRSTCEEEHMNALGADENPPRDAVDIFPETSPSSCLFRGVVDIAGLAATGVTKTARDSAEQRASCFHHMHLQD